MVHQYKCNGYNIIIDSNSGSVHSVDEVAYDIIELWNTNTKKEITKIILEKYKELPDVTESELEEVFADIEELIKQGKLFSEDIFQAMAPEMKNRQSVVKAMCLHIAHDCNMDCQYCFAGKGEYHGEKGLMSYEVGKRAFDYLIENSGTRKNLEVDFFGGEPLMNFEVVKKLVAYGREQEKLHDKNFRFTLTTNGLWLNDEVIDFTTKEMSNVVISLDGRKEVNDRMRNTKTGGGTYDIIMDGFKKLAEARNQEDYYMRGTYTRYNLDFSKDVLHMADMGFKQLSIEPVVAPSTAPYALKEEDLPILFEEYEKLAVEMLKRQKEGEGFTFYHYMIDLMGGPCIAKRISGCGVGTEYIAVTPGGELYPCHQFVGEEKYLLGNIYDGITNKGICEEFTNCNVYSHEECKDCFAKLYCSGGCAANAYHATGKVTGIYKMGCELQKKRIECAIMMKVAEMQQG